MASNALQDQRLVRLKEALVAVGVVRGERDKMVADVTGYAKGSIRRLLSGGTPLTGNFIKAVCIKFNIRWKWIKDGEEPMLAQQGESPYPDPAQIEESNDVGGLVLIDKLQQVVDFQIKPVIEKIKFVCVSFEIDIDGKRLALDLRRVHRRLVRALVIDGGCNC